MSDASHTTTEELAAEVASCFASWGIERGDAALAALGARAAAADTLADAMRHLAADDCKLACAYIQSGVPCYSCIARGAVASYEAALAEPGGAHRGHRLSAPEAHSPEEQTSLVPAPAQPGSANALADALRKIEHYPFYVMASPETDLARVKEIARVALAAYDAARKETP